MISRFSRLLLRGNLVNKNVKCFGSAKVEAKQEVKKTEKTHDKDHSHKVDHHDEHHDDHHDHHHVEALVPGAEGGWEPSYDWRRDPCLEWGYGGHHHEAKYDWRDDPKFNPDLYKDVRDIGSDQIVFCSFPYTGTHDSQWWFPQIPDNYKGSDLSLNLLPQNKHSDLTFNGLRAPYQTLDSDVAHEYDYESEDLDFQCESFKMQHFRKKGPISQWVFAGFLPLIYFYIEYLYTHYPDEDNWKIPHPPPLNYPDTEDTDDTDTYNDYHSKEGKYLRDSGIVGDLWFDIVDGKKVYRRFAGVNQPLPDI